MQLLDKARSVTRPTLRVQLTLLYSGLVMTLCGGALAAAGLLIRRRAGVAASSPASVIASFQHASDVHVFEVGAAIIFVVAALIALALGWWIAGRLLGRLRTITATARDISASNLHRRLAFGGPDDEVKELGQTLDELFGRLEASFESQRHFVANASHELRSPLTTERTLLQVALADPDATVETWRSTGEKVLKWSDHQGQLIEALLTLASSEGGIDQWECFDLAEVTDNLLQGRREVADRQGLQIDAILNEALALGDAKLVESMVANLVDNAIRHNIEGGRIEISTSSVGGRSRISVGNTGPVISAQEVDRLFQPFQRSGGERVRTDGHGLGLAIVQAVARAHGGTLAALPRVGGGLDIAVTFSSRAANADPATSPAAEANMSR